MSTADTKLETKKPQRASRAPVPAIQKDKTESVNVDDLESIESLTALDVLHTLRQRRIPGVKTVLLVLSSRGMVFDVEALRQKVLAAYPDAAVFFRSTSGRPVGVASPQSVDLLIDLTGPGQRQGWFYSRKLRKMARFAVGRNAGLFRKRLYDRVFDEREPNLTLPADFLDREKQVQKEVLALAGIAVIPAAETTPDRSKTIALELPPLSQQ